LADNSNSIGYFFTIDSIKPIITLGSPLNNSIIPSGALLNFSVIDSNLMEVNYSINGGSNISLTAPFDISTSGWIDGDYTIQINAQDEARNSNSSWYFFTLDSTSPIIILNSPGNNSIILDGTTLDFAIIESNLDQANYSVNGGLNVSLPDPFDISTSGWVEGDYTVSINAKDVVGNLNTSWFFFTIDSTKPYIKLNSPLNNSVIPNGTLINLSIIDLHMIQVNYSINGGPDIPLSDPFDISTSGWVDGDYTVQINVKDEAGNSNSSWYFFTLDSASPTIILNTPGNNSIIQAGIPLDFSIIEPNLAQVNYSVNGGLDMSLLDPFDISTSGWTDGDYTVQINALDIAGNLTTAWFFFEIDSIRPEIMLNSPGNNSYIPSGIILNFTVDDLNLDFANYSINGGADIPLSDPFDISTSGWIDGAYTVQINAQDMAGNINSSWHFFTIDSQTPVITLNDPLNNSIHPSGLILDFSISDPNLDHVNYSINIGPSTPFFDPFDISTFGWSDGDYAIYINAEDMAGNKNSSWYFFTVDSTMPTIQLISPLNNSIISEGTLLDFSVSDSNLDYVNYSINAGADSPLSVPYNIPTSGWADGDYAVQINTEDMAGNKNSSWYFFTLDSTMPTIQLISPLNNSIIFAGILLDFSVSDSNLDLVIYSINGGPDISLSDPYDISTSGWADGDYTVQINAQDAAGNSNSSWYFFTVDATSPTITLNSPGNNSIISSGTLLDFLVTDTDLLQTNYSINGGANIPFADPFDISTVGWAEGDYTITINAEDVVGNKNTLWFFFTIDSTIPTIQLNLPLNNSIIPSDTILDFLITDQHLDFVNFSVNGGVDIALSAPFDISTTGWIDGDYTVQINALDLAGNSNSSSYLFTMDSTLPQIILNAPSNNSVIPEGTVLDFSIDETHLSQVNYSVNGGAETPFMDPYNISTAGWSDGDFVIQITTMDLAGNFNSSWYLFTIDSTLPMFLLNTPENNSVIPNGTILDFDIVETNLDQVNYSVNGGPNISFSDPFNISTSGWLDRDYAIQINAVDLAENSNSSWYFFTVDSSMPNIVLNNPENNSFIPNSTILNFSIIDPHLTQVNYSINAGVDIPLTDPYNISISGLPDGDYTIQINAVDVAENSNSSWYFFTIDSTLPTVILEAPVNNSIVQNGTILNFTIVDTHLMQVNYSINGGADTNLSDPFDISTLGWTDGDFTIQINTIDLAGNSNSSWYFISIDSTSPAIILNTPQNNSAIQDGTVLDFLILDSNLLEVNYSINGGINNSLSDPFNITTAGWTDDNYTIQINALDMVGNSISVWYFFTIDSTAPEIILNTPENNSVVQGGVILDFSIIDPNPIQANYSINGGVDNAFSDPFNIPTSGWEDGDYTIQIIATDQPGNSNSLWFYFKIDSTPPTISIDPNLNHSIISIGEIIQLNISDPDTNTVMYSINGGEHSAIIPPYNIDTSAFLDGRHTINVTANDTLGNEAIFWFEVYVITETLFSLKDDIGDVMNEDEEQVGGHSDIDMINISIWKVGDYLLYEMSVEGIVRDQMVGSDVYFYSLSLFMDETDDPENKDDKDFTINCSLGLVNIENEDTGETQSLEAFGYGTSTLRLLIPLTFIDDDTDFKISADNIVYINLDLDSGTYDEAYLDTSLDAIDLLFDTDNDGIPDDEDDDDDNDDYLDDEDDFPLDATEWLDTDGDGIGNNADTDDDDDGHPDDEDDLPLDATDWQDTDSDGIGNKLDIDDDDDGYFDTIEISEGTDPLDDESIPKDYDGDFLPDSIDPDDDDDGVLDVNDDYPFDSTKSKKPSDAGFGLIILLIIIVIVIVLVVLLFLRKRGRGADAEEAPATEGETIAFGGMEMQGQVLTEGEGAFGLGEGVPTAVPEAATYKCPHCEKSFTAPIYQQAMIAVCPSCGNRTTIGHQKRTEEQQLN
jgi:transcription initiation factor IIF auxiliary subunit/DNA-directed RNA polymerase subunit RPC12/RpoP